MLDIPGIKDLGAWVEVYATDKGSSAPLTVTVPKVDVNIVNRNHNLQAVLEGSIPIM